MSQQYLLSRQAYIQRAVHLQPEVRRTTMYALTPYPITPVGCFFGIILALLPLLSRRQAWNTGVCMYAIWIALVNLITFVDTIIWHNNVHVVVPVWCDISAL